jgi:transposase
VSESKTLIEHEVETLREEKSVLVKELDRERRENAWLRERLKHYMRRIFGAKAEKIDPSQLALPFEELIDLAVSLEEPAPTATAQEAADDEADTHTQKQRRKGAHGRRPLPKELPRLRVEIHPDEADRTCKCCRQPMAVIGEETSEELDYQPATLAVTEHVRVKYACKSCEDGVVIAPLPPRLIEKGRPGPGLLAQVAVSKYADHLPLHRQESIFERHGVDLSRQTLCDWIGATAEHLTPIVAALKASVLASAVIHSDDTPLLCQENAIGGGKTRAYLWTYVRDQREVVYDFTMSRERDGPERFLGDWSGHLQVDAYAGYDRLFASGRVIEVACWAHARRKYFDALAGNAERASRMLALIQRLYRVESEAKELAPRERAALRRERSAPILAQIRAQLDADQKHVLPKSGLGEATTYLANQWDALQRYVDDGRLDIDNNAAERAMRCVAVGRKNWLFAGSPKGGERAAVIYSLIATCKLQGVEPFEYLRDVLTRLPEHPRERMAELTPRNWKPAREKAAAH